MPPKSPSQIGPPDVEEAVAVMRAARARGRGRRSPLYLWFLNNHAALVSALEQSAPAWADLAAYLGEHGLRDADGKMPTARAARDAWYRVRRDKAAKAAPKSAKTMAPEVPSVRVLPTPAPAPQPAETPPAQGADVQDILGRLGGTRSRGGRLPKSVE